MKRLTLSLVLAVCMACSKGKPPGTARQGPEPPMKQASSNLITLDAAAQKSSKIEIGQVTVRSLPQIVRSTGRITTDEDRTWRVGAITDGRVMAIRVNPGDRVEQWQVLAFMHSHDVHESRAQYLKAVGELARQRASESYALRGRDRARRLYELKAGSLEQLEHAENVLRNAATEVTTAQVEVERTRTHLVEFLGIDPDKKAKPGDEGEEEDWIPVKAPAAGTILTRSVSSGTVVTPANDLFILTDLSSLWVIAEVNEEHLSKLRAGMPVRVFVQAYPDRPFYGKIAKLGESLDAATRTLMVRVALANKDGLLKPEMYAATEIELGGSQAAPFIPQEAIQEVRGQNVVFVRRDSGSFEVRPVGVGRSLNGSVEISRGLREGEQIAITGSFILKSEFLKASLAEE